MYLAKCTAIGGVNCHMAEDITGVVCRVLLHCLSAPWSRSIFCFHPAIDEGKVSVMCPRSGVDDSVDIRS